MAEGLAEVRAGARLGELKAAEQPMELALARRRADVVAHFVVEDDQTSGVALILDGEVEERGGGEARVVHFADSVRGEVHRIASVEQNCEQAVRFAAIALQVGALRAGEDVPIHVPQVVARSVGAIFGELLAEAEVRRAVKTGDETVHDRLGDEVEAGNRAQHRRIEKALHS